MLYSSGVIRENPLSKFTLTFSLNVSFSNRVILFGTLMDFIPHSLNAKFPIAQGVVFSGVIY